MEACRKTRLVLQATTLPEEILAQTRVRRDPALAVALLDQPPPAVILGHSLDDVVLPQRQLSRLIRVKVVEPACNRLSVDGQREMESNLSRTT